VTNSERNNNTKSNTKYHITHDIMQFDPKPRCGGSVVSFAVMLLIIGADFAVGRPGIN